MTHESLTEIVCILDRSGSMEAVRLDAIRGFNNFLGEQEEIGDDVLFTLVQFDDQYEIVHNGVNIKEVPKLDYNTFVPRGSTALYDAIGRTINDVTARHGKADEAELPAKVIVAILTDGEENSSKEFIKEDVFDMIQRQTDYYNWDFIYLGANQDAIKEASQIGIKSQSSINYSSASDGFTSMSNSVSQIRYSHHYEDSLKGTCFEKSSEDPNSNSFKKGMKKVKKKKKILH
jgi:uncharacterized protein YegL